ncbi:hypothetical protein HaLaN_06479 [Haematococcus lacustris]|uniref:Uncharacterized protein n=1 Tax=Haematococcus lacustris TaxID=44745 RepID=A0A699YLA7_HAELA|nr:hypothetical protein HaLaN_06479 [Haematococcus lacustris]
MSSRDVLVALSTVATGEPDPGADSPTRHITPLSHPRGRNSLWRTWDGVTELLPLNRSQAHRSGSLRPPSRHTDPPLASQPEERIPGTDDHDGGGDAGIAVAHQHAASRTSSCASDSAAEQPAGRQVPGGLKRHWRDKS